MGSKPTAAGLLAFEKANRTRPGMACAVCALPERAVIDEAKRESAPGKLGGKTVRRWLISECGYPDDLDTPSRAAIDHHFHQDHHLR